MTGDSNGMGNEGILVGIVGDRVADNGGSTLTVGSVDMPGDVGFADRSDGDIDFCRVARVGSAGIWASGSSGKVGFGSVR